MQHVGPTQGLRASPHVLHELVVPAAGEVEQAVLELPQHRGAREVRWRASLQHPSRGAFAALVLGPHITILLVSRGPFCTHSWATRDGETSQENGDLHS